MPNERGLKLPEGSPRPEARLSKFGRNAVGAVLRAKEGNLSPKDAWNLEAAETFREAPASRVKGCPREAFLGLCDAGMVRGVSVKQEEGTRRRPNRDYARTAARMLSTEPGIALLPKTEIWRRVLAELELPTGKKHNSQIDVVLALWKEGLLEVD